MSFIQHYVNQSHTVEGMGSVLVSAITGSLYFYIGPKHQPDHLFFSIFKELLDARKGLREDPPLYLIVFSQVKQRHKSMQLGS